MQYLVFVAAGVSLVSTYVYLRSMLNGHAKPNRVTWLMWSVAPMTAFVAAVSEGAGLATVPAFTAGLCTFMIFAFSFVVKEASWKLTRFDYACGVLSAVAVVFWGVTGNPDFAIVFAILSDILASVPTLMKGWQHPETESSAAYLTGVFSGLTGFLAVTVWTFSQYAFPAYLVAISSVLVLSVHHKRISTYLSGFTRRLVLQHDVCSHC